MLVKSAGGKVGRANDMKPSQIVSGSASLGVLVFQGPQSEYLTELLLKERDDPECFNTEECQRETSSQLDRTKGVQCASVSCQREASTLLARRKGVLCASVSWLVQCLITQKIAPIEGFLLRGPQEAPCVSN